MFRHKVLIPTKANKDIYLYSLYIYYTLYVILYIKHIMLYIIIYYIYSYIKIYKLMIPMHAAIMRSNFLR